MAATTTQVPVEEYLSTDYSPDCDYVDGEVQERNMGEKDHSRLQKRLIVHLDAVPGCEVYPELRIQVGPGRYRVPDVCLVVGPEPDEQILTRPPFLCIEILSPEDRMSRMMVKIEDFLAFGVRYVWVIEPHTRRAYIYTRNEMREVADGVLRTANPDIALPLSELFGG
jgi:Uma2 family endonuclease